MSNARSPRDVCSTTIGIKAIKPEVRSQNSEVRRTALILASDYWLLTPPFLPPTLRQSRAHLLTAVPTLCDCSTWQRCYVRLPALSRYHALVPATVWTRRRSRRSRRQSPADLLRSFLRRRGVRAKATRADHSRLVLSESRAPCPS